MPDGGANALIRPTVNNQFHLGFYARVESMFNRTQFADGIRKIKNIPVTAATCNNHRLVTGRAFSALMTSSSGK